MRHSYHYNIESSISASFTYQNETKIVSIGTLGCKLSNKVQISDIASPISSVTSIMWQRSEFAYAHVTFFDHSATHFWNFQTQLTSKWIIINFYNEFQPKISYILSKSNSLMWLNKWIFIVWPLASRGLWGYVDEFVSKSRTIVQPAYHGNYHPPQKPVLGNFVPFW